MTSSREADHTDERTKHLDMIQGVVSRMAGNSAAMKRYCIIAVAVGVAVYKTINDPWAVAALGVMVVVFWGLDARYLQQEKWFRDLYDQVRSEPPDRRPDFRLAPDRAMREGASFWRRVFKWSMAGLFLTLVVLIFLFWRALRRAAV